MSDIKTVGIVGGGLSGMAAGVMLARRGLRVRLFEANEKVGGCCAVTRLQGYTFNDGAMYVALPEILDRAFERLGLDRRSAVPLRRITFNQTTTLPDGTVIVIGSGRDVRIRQAGDGARNSTIALEIDSLIKRWRPVLRLFATELLVEPFSPARLLRKVWRHLPKLHGTLATELERRVSDPAARAALAGTMLFTGHPAAELPVSQILGLVAMLDDGFHLPEDGMGAIPNALEAALRRQGGEVTLGARVRKIRTTHGRASGLDVDGQGGLPVDAVISTVSGMLTFGSLLDAEDVPQKMRQKVKAAPLSHRALSVQLGLSNRLDVSSHSISFLPMMEEQYQLFRPSDGTPRWLNYTVPTITVPELAPAGGSVVEMFPPIDQTGPVDRWNESATEAVAQTAIAALSRVHAMDVAVKRIRGPKEYRDSMNLFGGAVYGLSPAAGPRAQFPHETTIEGLFQAGQTTYPGFGVGPAMMSGIFAAEALMRRALR